MKDRKDQLEMPDCRPDGACRGYCQLYDAYNEALDRIKMLETEVETRWADALWRQLFGE